jgi:hypothetical protein
LRLLQSLPRILQTRFAFAYLLPPLQQQNAHTATWQKHGCFTRFLPLCILLAETNAALPLPFQALWPFCATHHLHLNIFALLMSFT